MAVHHRRLSAGVEMRCAGALEEHFAGLILRRRGDAQFETKFRGGENPRDRHIARAITDECHHATANRSALFLKRKNVGQNLAWMLLISQCVDRGNLRILRKLFDIALRVGADHTTVNHPAEDARGVLHRFAATHLDFVGDQEQRVAAEFVNTHVERHAGARRGLGENHRPRLAGEGFGILAAISFEIDSRRQHRLHVGGGHFFETQQVLHNRLAPGKRSSRADRGTVVTQRFTEYRRPNRAAHHLRLAAGYRSYAPDIFIVNQPAPW